MKSSKALLCTLLCAFTTVTLAAEPGQPIEREKAVMLYFTKSFGSDQRNNRAPLAFGLRLQQSSTSGAMRPIALMDARYSFGGRKTFALGGFPAFDSTNESSDGSSTSSTTSSADMSQKHPGWTTAMIVLAVFGGMCLTETWVCEGDGRRTPESPGLGND
jgi:hypothetical protein